MHVAVDQPGRDTGAPRVDAHIRAVGVAVGTLSDGDDQAVAYDDRVGIQDGPVEIARQQQADVFNDDLSGFFSSCDVRHAVLLRGVSLA